MTMNFFQKHWPKLLALGVALAMIPGFILLGYHLKPDIDPMRRRSRCSDPMAGNSEPLPSE